MTAEPAAASELTTGKFSASRIFASPLDARGAPFTAVPPDWRTGVASNLAGGALAAVVSLPLAMGLGILALAPFGPEFAARGAAAGLYAAAFLGLVTVLMGARGVAIYAPRSLVSFMIAAVAADLYLEAGWLPANDPNLLAAAIFLLLAIAGAFQLIFGLARVARIVKYIPTPVMAGFQNAAAIIIIISQAPALFGLAKAPALAEWPAALATARPLSVAVCVLTLVMLFQAPRLTQRVPPLVVGLAAGTVLHFLFIALGLGAHAGPTLGRIDVGLPNGDEVALVMSLFMVPGFTDALPAIVLGGVSIALVASLDVLISAKIVENMTRRRGNATQELVAIGAANAVTPLLGGICGSISLAATTTAFKGGGRNSLALLVHASLFLVLVPLLAPMIGHIPRAVIAALLIYAGIQLVDKWTLQLLGRIASGRVVQWRGILIDLCVIVLVASIAIFGQVVIAVLVGVAVAVVVFTLRMSRGVIRRERTGDIVQSRRARESSDAAFLVSHGQRILALELEGPIFFASAELLHNRIDQALAEGARWVILDVTRVNELDSTGARILVQLDERLRAVKCRLVVCGSEAHPEVAGMLRDHGVADALTREHMFPDLDQALERCEDELLATLRSPEGARGEHPFEMLDIVRGLEESDRRILLAALIRREYRADQTIFQQGDEGDALYIIARGSASVWLRDAAAGQRRLMTFSPGTFFGEMALLDRERRSATITTDEPLVCWVLERASFEQLAREYPHTGQALLANLARELSLRMRRANRTLLELS